MKILNYEIDKIEEMTEELIEKSIYYKVHNISIINIVDLFYDDDEVDFLLKHSDELENLLKKDERIEYIEINNQNENVEISLYFY